jgi:transposase
LIAANATFALKAGEWFRRGLLLIAAPDSRASACPLSGRNSTYRTVRNCGATSVIAKKPRLSSKGPLAKAIDYTFNHWQAFTRFLGDGRICLSNNAAERAIRGIAVGRRNWTFCGSDEGGHRAAVMYTLIESALCRVRHKADYAERRTMPNGFLGQRSYLRFFKSLEGFIPAPFGIILPVTMPSGMRANGRWAENG